MVSVATDPQGTGVSAVDALLDFDTLRLRVLAAARADSPLTDDVEITDSRRPTAWA